MSWASGFAQSQYTEDWTQPLLLCLATVACVLHDSISAFHSPGSWPPHVGTPRKLGWDSRFRAGNTPTPKLSSKLGEFHGPRAGVLRVHFIRFRLTSRVPTPVYAKPRHTQANSEVNGKRLILRIRWIRCVQLWQVRLTASGQLKQPIKS